MARLQLVEDFGRAVTKVRAEADLHEALARVSHDMGFAYFALVRHVDDDRGGIASRIHNYPDQWVRYFEDHRLGRNDPIHRASHRVIMGFSWDCVEALVPLTRKDKAHLEKARAHGLANGYTVPANIPGETSGSCSFAISTETSLPLEQLPVAQLIGNIAFESARRLRGNRRRASGTCLTARQRDCVLWAARGKTDWEIAQILGIAHETVIRHLKFARERYGVMKRASLVVCALHDGLFSYADILDFNHFL